MGFDGSGLSFSFQLCDFLKALVNDQETPYSTLIHCGFAYVL